MQKAINKGFTLIELLVVIAIIGILAAIVLVSLGNARQKGADAGIQGNLDSIRTQAEVYSSNNSNKYNPTTAVPALGSNATPVVAGSACGGNVDMWADPTLKQALISAGNNAGSATLAGVTAAEVCIAGPAAAAAGAQTTWVVAVVLKSDPTRVWCVDNSGKAESALASLFTPANTAGALTACP